MSGTPVSPPPYRALIVQYALMTLYGLGGSVYGVSTLKVVSGEAWEALWPALLFVAASLAIAGVVRSCLTGKHGWEVVATVALIALLIGYAVAIALRSYYGGDPGHMYAALLPIIVIIFPFVRLLEAARGVKR